MPRRRRQQAALERVLGTPALFATAYGNVGSSIYYALGVTASYALGLTPVVFLIAGLIFAATAVTYAEGTVRYPEAGGSSSFARHAFNELVSFGAAWAQMLVYVATVAISAFFVPHYLSVFWEPLRTNPWDVIGGAIVIVALVAINIVGVKEAASLNVLLAVIDFATQGLLVTLGFVLIFSPDVLLDNIRLGVAPTWTQFFISIPIAMLAYTGVETVSNLAEEARDPAKNVPQAYKLVAAAVFAIYLTLPLVALSALPVFRQADGDWVTLLGLPPEEGGYTNDPVLGVVKYLGIEQDALLHGLEVYVGVLAATILFIATNAGVIGASRITYAMSGYRQLPLVFRRLHPTLQDAVARARGVRGRRSDRHDPARGRHVPRDDVLVRRHALVHRRALVDRRAARAAPERGDAVPRQAEPSRGRDRVAAVRAARSCSGPGSRSSSSSSRIPSRAGPGSAGSSSASSAT